MGNNISRSYALRYAAAHKILIKRINIISRFNKKSFVFLYIHNLFTHAFRNKPKYPKNEGYNEPD